VASGSTHGFFDVMHRFLLVNWLSWPIGFNTWRQKPSAPRLYLAHLSIRRQSIKKMTKLQTMEKKTMKLIWIHTTRLNNVSGFHQESGIELIHAKKFSCFESIPEYSLLKSLKVWALCILNYINVKIYKRRGGNLAHTQSNLWRSIAKSNYLKRFFRYRVLISAQHQHSFAWE